MRLYKSLKYLKLLIAIPFLVMGMVFADENDTTSNLTPEQKAEKLEQRFKERRQIRVPKKSEQTEKIDNEERKTIQKNKIKKEKEVLDKKAKILKKEDSTSITFNFGYSPNFMNLNQTGDYEAQGTILSFSSFDTELTIGFADYWVGLSYALTGLTLYNDATTAIKKSNSELYMKFGYSSFYGALGILKNSEFLLAQKGASAEWTDINSITVLGGYKKDWITKQKRSRFIKSVDLALGIPISSSSGIGVLKVNSASGYFLHVDSALKKDFGFLSEDIVWGGSLGLRFDYGSLKHDISLNGTTKYSVTRILLDIRPSIVLYLEY